MSDHDVPVSTDQSPRFRVNARDIQQTLLRIGFAIASVAIGSVITYFKEDLLIEFSDEAIFALVITILIGLLEAAKRFFDGVPVEAAQDFHSGFTPEGYTKVQSLKKIAK